MLLSGSADRRSARDAAAVAPTPVLSNESSVEAEQTPGAETAPALP